MKYSWSRFGVLAVIMILGFPAFSGAAETEGDDKAEGASSTKFLEGNNGIAKKYKSDKGIEKDKAVLFREDFDSLTSISELKGKPWTDIENKADALTLADTGRGKASLKITATRGKNAGGYLYVKMKQGYDVVYARYYVKFAKDAGYTHHFCSLGGTSDPSSWPVGKAGLRPGGNEKFGTGLEPDHEYGKFPPPGRWIFYVYWHQMKSWNGSQYYGNCFRVPEQKPIPRDKWICVERMIRVNSKPGKSDGAMAFWVDGKLVEHWGPGGQKGHWSKDNWVAGGGQAWPGFEWRTDKNLKINYFKIESFVSEDAFKNSEKYGANYPKLDINTKEHTVYFDDIVVATKYIGPKK